MDPFDCATNLKTTTNTEYRWSVEGSADALNIIFLALVELAPSLADIGQDDSILLRSGPTEAEIGRSLAEAAEVRRSRPKLC